jgi:integrase
VQRTRAGLLRFRFRWRLPDGRAHYFSEATALLDNPANRLLVEKQATIIGAEIRARTFDYLKWFPGGNRSKDFEPPKNLPGCRAGERLTVRDYYEHWIRDKAPPNVRASLGRDYRGHFRNYILDKFGDVLLRDLSLAHLEDLRTSLRTRGLSEKTIRNVVDGSFRAMVRDAGRDDIHAGFPFAKVRWAEKIVPGPSPLTGEERDRILDYFRTKRWKVGGFNDTAAHYPYFAFLYTLFFTGMRPSELCAVRIRSVNFKTGIIHVDRSRHLGVEAAPKTQRARRSVRLTRTNVEVLKPLLPLRAHPDDYVFRNVRGEPVEPANFYDLFRDAQRALEISPLHDLYSTKDTYISLALTNGVSLTWLSEQTGVAVATILKHYGRFVHSSQTDAIELARIDCEQPPPDSGEFGHHFGHRDVPFRKNPRFSSISVASPTGFEPVLPT